MKNDYDKYAKERQERLINGMMPPHRFVEKPMMKSMIPNLKDKKILMLGCGTGEESKLLETFGADKENLVGLDLSKESINIARESYPEVEFVVGDMSILPFEDSTFDFVYSSLAIHYSATPDTVYKEVYRVLKKDGLFLFSLVHPIRWASAHKEIDGKMYRIIGCSRDDNESEVFGSYNTFKEHSHNFFSWGLKENLSFYVVSPSFHFKLLRKANFEVLDFTESSAIEETKEVDINYYKKNKELPQFMAFLAKK
ncbi:MAG: class I SAM-dependent methyltransferase [Erysipelotrichales bacterium]|nr:class I SAM-dependent methyltransferase [Erysipelotrichales bacterium]